MSQQSGARGATGRERSAETELAAYQLPDVHKASDAEKTRDAEFTLFYEQQMPQLIAHLIVQGVPRDDVSDAAQEAMALVYRDWDRVDSPRAWVRTVAIRGWLRHRDEACLPAPIGPEKTFDTSDVLSSEALDAILARADFLQLILPLPFDERRVLAWAFDGYTPAETARHLGLNPSTVRTHLGNARAAVLARIHRGDWKESR